MQIAITLDDVTSTRYTIGKYDFYTRQAELSDDLVAKLAKLAELDAVVQRVLAAIYVSQGKFILPADLETIECINIVPAVAATPEPQSDEQPKQKASGPRSSSESRRLSMQKA